MSCPRSEFADVAHESTFPSKILKLLPFERGCYDHESAMAEPASPDVVTTVAAGRREAVATSCLDDPAALAFVEGSCEPAERSAIVEHVAECADCRELVSGLLHTETGGDGADSWGGPAITGEQIGPYKFGPMIAEGGMGQIYRATETKLGRDVAIKVPRVLDRGLLLRFEREVAITARLQHPGIVPIHGAGVLPDGTPFYVMRFIEGTALHELVARAPDLTARLELVKHLVSVADTMAYVHDENVVHRDLKPNNVLVGQFGETLIIDWGLAKDLRDRSAEPEASSTSMAIAPSGRGALDSDPPFMDSDMTRAGDILGTPAFMAPEQATGLRVDVRADVFALGCILRHLLTGRLALPVADHGSNFDGVPPALVAVHDRSTAIERDERYPDARAFHDALLAAIAPPPPIAGPRPKWHWAVPLLGLGGIAFGVTLLARSGSRGEVAAPAAGRATIELIDHEPPGTRALAFSPSGTRVGYGGLDRLEVRDLATKQTWTRPGWMQWPGIVMFETDDVVVYSVLVHGTRQAQRIRWDLRTKAAEPIGPAILADGAWFGIVAGGDITAKLNSPGLAIVRDGVRIDVETFEYRAVEHVAIAPSRQRFALLDARSPGTLSIRVVDAKGTSFVSPPIADVAALTWLDDMTLLYAVGSGNGSSLYRVAATPEGLAQPVQLYETREAGTPIGALAAARGRIVMSVVDSVFETHAFTIETHADERLDPVSAAAPLGWRDDGSWLAWNRSTQAVEVRTSDAGALPTVTPAIIHGDMANVTRANDILIAAIRDERGRWIEAVSLTNGKRLWSTSPGQLVFVRCANDAAQPCITGKVAASGRVELRRIDPATGAVGDLVIEGANIADAAIDATGTTLAWVTNLSNVHVRPLAETGAGTELSSALSGVHSLAFAPAGGVLATTFSDSTRKIVRLHDGEVELVVRTGGNVVSMVRPSSSGDRLLYRTRTLTANLVELHLSPR